MNFNPLTFSSISDKKQTIFNIYPNPTNGVFSIQLDVAKKYDVQVYNVLGQIVYTTYTNDLNNMIDLSNFDKGVYTIELKENNLKYIEKIIIE